MLYRIRCFLKKIKLRWLGVGRVIRRCAPGLPFPYYLREGTTDEFVEADIFGEHAQAIDCDFTPKTIIDAGANIGLRTIQLAARFPEAVILAVEPETDNFSLLLKNTAPYQNVRCLQGGVWRRDAYLRITNPEGAPWGFVVEEVGSPETGGEREIRPGELRAYSTESLMKQFGWETIDLYKIDIEGSEKELFENPDAVWLDRVKLFVLELHDRKKPGCAKAFFRALADRDYTLEIRADNLVVRMPGVDDSMA